jgi:hypothetical protein
MTVLFIFPLVMSFPLYRQKSSKNGKEIQDRYIEATLYKLANTIEISSGMFLWEGPGLPLLRQERHTLRRSPEALSASRAASPWKGFGDPEMISTRNL